MKKIKTYLSLMLAILMLLGIMPSAFAAPTATDEYWSNASAWAQAELLQAAELGLVPAALQNADLTKSINRLEFAAVAVKVYEALSGTPALPAVVNPFNDTSDIEVLKAYNIGAINGTSATTFSPQELLNREQAATMLTRVYKRVNIPGWTLQTDNQHPLSYIMPSKFADDSATSSWAKDSVYFMSANGIINGVGGGNFAPNDTATREQALAIVVRMVANQTGTTTPPITASDDLSQLDQEVTTVSAAYEASLSSLFNGNTEVEISTVMQTLYADAQQLESAGTIKNLQLLADGIFYDYASDVPGGIIIDLNSFTDTADTAAQATPSNIGLARPRFSTLNMPTINGLPPLGATTFTPTVLYTPFLAATASGAPNLIGNNSVFFGMAAPSIPKQIDTAGLIKLSNKEAADILRQRDFAVTENNTLTLSDLKTLDQYGAIFLNMHNTFTLNDIDPIVLLDEPFSLNKDEYERDLRIRVAGLYSFISPGKTVSAIGSTRVTTMDDYGHKLVYGVNMNNLFMYYYDDGKGSFANSFIHLGYGYSQCNPYTSKVLLGAGAGCVSGYSDYANRLTYDYDVANFLLTNLLKDDGTTSSKGRTVGQVDGTLRTEHNQFLKTIYYQYYDANKLDWKVYGSDITCQVVMKYNNSDLRLWADEEMLVASTAPVVVTAGSYYETTGIPASMGTHRYHVNWTIQNVGSEPITGIQFYSVINGEKSRLPMQVYANDSSSAIKLTTLNPDTSQSFDYYSSVGLTQEGWDSYGIQISAYLIGDRLFSSWTDIPLAEQVLFSFSRGSDVPYTP